MSITLELTPQEEELVWNAAREKGQSVALFLKERALHDFSHVSSLEATAGSTLWQQLSAAGKAAGRSAKTRAHALGSGVVYERAIAFVEEMPDGTIRILHPAPVVTIVYKDGGYGDGGTSSGVDRRKKALHIHNVEVATISLIAPACLG